MECEDIILLIYKIKKLHFKARHFLKKKKKVTLVLDYAL